jgi:hypothetical protein
VKVSWTRSPSAQIARMARLWPAIELIQQDTDVLAWNGLLRGGQQFYQTRVVLLLGSKNRPYVFLIEPKLAPRAGSTFAEIPHLIFHDEEPTRSALCLFDPDGKEWDSTMLIADTTVPWAARWLLYYELWHVDGIWRGGGVGYESIAAARAAGVHK